MEPLELLEQAIKDRSWPMVRAAFKALKEKPQVNLQPTKKVEVSEHPQLTLAGRPFSNQFVDDGTMFKEDISVAPTKRTERNRPEYTPRTLLCSRCGQSDEVDAQTYKYYKSGESPYICTKCF